MTAALAGSRDLLAYYRRRAREYERVYEKPERQADLAALRSLVSREMEGHEVLEIACGTGYWTRVCAGRARSVLAVDLAEETLEIAQAKEYPFGKVRFGRADAYRLEEIPDDFTAGLACFWWSHVPLERLAEFLAGWHRRLGPGARVVFVDNRYVEGSSTPISRTDARGNTYQTRRLADGSSHEVLKNFPSGDELLRAIQGASQDARLVEFPYYWCLSYRVAQKG
jgi:demethylmenaquinone methyltransferase/2-methoxy-6-polyprenyl-1,4-benzoquinol methylase